MALPPAARLQTRAVRLTKITRIAPSFRLLLALIAGLGCVVKGQSADTVESVQRTALEWAKLKEEKARIEREWTHERELLQAMIPAVQERFQELEEQRKLTDEKTATTRRDAEQEAAKSAALLAGIEKAKERLRGVSQELLRLRPVLPPRLSLALDFAFQSVADETLAPAERMRAVVTVLDRCAQFNAAITLSEEVLAVEGSKEVVVEVLYWGLAQAYALDRNGHRAYVGRPGATGWAWEPRPEAVPKIAAAIAAQRDEAEPRFVVLPAKVSAQNPVGR